MDINEFLNHSTRSAGSSDVLRWKKDKKLNAVFHTRANFDTVWQHKIQRMVTFDEENGTKTLKVFGGEWNCHESDARNKKQFHRDRTTQELLYPPATCGYCKMLAWIERQVKDGKLGIVDPLFHWRGDDATNAVTFTTGGIIGAFYDGYEADISAQQKDQITRSGYRVRDSWMEKAWAKLAYVFCVVNADNPDACHVVFETTSLGDKVKKVIRDRITEFGDITGNPIRNPYVIQFQYNDAKNIPFNEKYHALAMSTIAITPEILKLITIADPPSTTKLREPGNVQQLWADLELRNVGLTKIPLGDFFGSMLGSQQVPVQLALVPSAAQAFSAAVDATVVAAAAAPAPTAAAIAAPITSATLYACERCKVGRMRADEFECKGCGARYDQQGALLPEEPKPAPAPTRRGAIVETTLPIVAPPVAAPPTGGGPAWPTPSGMVDGGDDVPF